MLVLKREFGQAIVIGDDIRVMVVGVRGNQVRIGIEAPAAVAVHRQEVYDAIHRQDGHTSDKVTEAAKAGHVGSKRARQANLAYLLASALVAIRDQDWKPDPRTIREAEAVLAMHPQFNPETGVLGHLNPIVDGRTAE